jgi:fluoroacetyl-CoA thioesterase
MADMPPVFATAYMVAFVEAACIEALAPYLEAGEATVGTHVNISHLAATPVGLAVTAQVELVSTENRKLIFQVRCHDEADLIGEGLHERCVVNRQRFISGVEVKSVR